MHKITLRPLLTGVGVVAAALTIAVGTAAPASAATKISHANAASQLSAASVGWTSSGGCSDRNNSTCTSFEQINQSTIDGVITLDSASGCNVLITGGTEAGHAAGTYSHWNGYKVDIWTSTTTTTCIDLYIRGNFTYIGDRGDGAPQYQSAAGNIYANEGNHWDITYF